MSTHPNHILRIAAISATPIGSHKAKTWSSFSFEVDGGAVKELFRYLISGGGGDRAGDRGGKRGGERGGGGDLSPSSVWFTSRSHLIRIADGTGCTRL